MATTTTITKILLRRGTDAERQSIILASGEPGWATDTKRLYVGDGTTFGGIPVVSADSSYFEYKPSGGGAQFLSLNQTSIDAITGSGATSFPVLNTSTSLDLGNIVYYTSNLIC